MALVRVGKKVIKEYTELMRGTQDNKCAVCHEPFTFKDNAVLDHCHFTGHLRAVLHRSCNSAEGRVLSMAEKISGGKGVPYLVHIAKKVYASITLTALDTKVVNACARGHSGVSGRTYIVGLATYYIRYEIPKHSLIHPSHHLPFERKGVKGVNKNWR